jgi:hypothetical protein
VEFRIDGCPVGGGGGGGEFPGGHGFRGPAEVFEDDGSEGQHLDPVAARVVYFVAEAFGVVVGEGFIDILQGGVP